MAETFYTDTGRFRSYRRHLPHRFPEGFPVFFTWNLKGALPDSVLKEIDAKRSRLENEPARAGESPYDRKIRHDKLLFAFRDHHLDFANDGPLYLKEPAAAQIVVESILFGVPERYGLYAFAVMANHVHVVLLPHRDPEKILQGMKGTTSYKINGLQNQRGRVLWQDETYDHWARDTEELHRIIEYVENNPVAAGLCARPEDWPWSSAAMRIAANWKKGDLLARLK